MRTRPVLLALVVGAAGVAAGGRSAAQPPLPAGGNVNPNRVAPASPDAFPATYVRPYSEWTPQRAPSQTAPRPGAAAAAPGTPLPNPYVPAGGFGANPQPGGRPRLTSPAVAGGDVRPAGFDIPPPSMDLPGARPGSLPPPDMAPPGTVPGSRMTPAPLPVPGGGSMPLVPVPGGGSAARPAPPPAGGMSDPTDSKFPPAPPAVTDLKPATPPAVSPAAPAPLHTPTPFTSAPPAPTFGNPPAEKPAPVAAAPGAFTAPTAPPKPATPAAPVAAAPVAVTPMIGGPSAGPSAVVGNLPGRLTPNVTVETIAPETVNFGQEFKYELVVRNTGQTSVTGVRVEDEIPTGAKYLGSEPPAEQNGDRLSWTLGALEAGAERRIWVKVKPSEEGEVRTRATVTFATAVDARTRVTRPRVTVSMTAQEVCRVGESPVFVMKVTNSGSGPAAKVMLQAKLTDGLYHAQGGVIEAELADLMPGASKEVKLAVVANKAGLHGCQLHAACEGSADATARAAVNVVEPLLQVKQTGPGRCLVRAEPVYAIELANPGTAGTDPVQVHAVVPDGFEYVSASDGGAFNPSSRAVSWQLPGLPAGSSRPPLSLKLRAVAAADGMLRTVAQTGTEAAAPPSGVVGASARTGPRLEARAETAVKSEGVAAIRFEIAGAEGVVEVGKEAVYEIKVSNQGTGPCTNVQLVGGLADGTTYTGSSGPTQVRAQGQQIVFDPIPNLGVKGEAVYRVRIRGVNPGDARFRVQLVCNEVRNPVVKEESTRFYKE